MALDRDRLRTGEEDEPRAHGGVDAADREDRASLRVVGATRLLVARSIVVLASLHLVGCNLGERTSRLPASVTLPPAVPLFDVVCVTGSTRRLCAVVLDRTEAVASSPDTAFVVERLPGSTSTSTTWFSAPNAVAPRAFTLLSDDGSRSAVSASKVLLYHRSERYGSPVTDDQVALGHVAYVVDVDGAHAIDGAHSEARFFKASAYWGVAGEGEERPSEVSPEDLAWQRAAPTTRRVVVAKLLAGPVERRTEGALAARLELAERGEGWARWRCDSFSYAIERDPRGRYSCAAAGAPPQGILVVDGRARWSFGRAW